MKFLMAGAAARRLGVSTEYLRQLVSEGRVPAYRTERGYRIFELEDIEHFAAERQEKKKKVAAASDEA